ncbi:citrate lyase subunit alpha [Selenomonadales bacterium OttesenSCG-928-I06]|nr:citrate lyase subunit alpha [Selenomonadales bacterium OttesenSCG-928-I06]
MKNSLGREIPEFIEGYGEVRPFKGAFATVPEGNRAGAPLKTVNPGHDKMLDSIEAVFKKVPITDGMTLAFHHHLRNGDYVVNMVMDVAAKLGLKDLEVSLTGVFPTHEPLIEHMKNGVITGLRTSGIYGPIAKAVTQGVLKKPAVLHTHGGRPAAVAAGRHKVDVAFVAAPTVDTYGNITGRQGPAACGALGYAMTDAEFASVVVAVSDNVIDYPLTKISIPQTKVDYIVKVDCIGDPNGIVSGTTQMTTDPVKIEMAQICADVIKASGYLKDGFSFQTGAGGASLKAADYVSQMMEEGNIKGSFAMGGIHGYMIQMVEKGLFKAAFDVQTFDLESIASYSKNENHIEMSAEFYASPFCKGALVNKLDAVILGATEIDVNFNVNVVSGSTGFIMGGSGGHSDAAAGADLTIIVANLVRSGKYPIVMDEVTTITTPGETIDVVVTDCGIAVNPARKELKDRLVAAGLPVKTIEELKKMADDIVGGPQKRFESDGRVVAVVEYRDGTVIDVVREIKA